MPFMAKQGNNYEEVETLVDTEGREIDYVLSKVGNTYKRTFTKVRELEDAPPLEFKSIKPQANLLDYRIYGQTSRNLLYKRIANANIYSTGQIITEQQNDVMIAKVSSGETYTVNGVEGVLGFFENEPVFGSYTYNNSRTLVGGGQIQYTFTVPSGCNYVGIRTISGATNVMLHSGSTPIPYEPYGESVGDRTGNLFDETNGVVTDIYIKVDGTTGIGANGDRFICNRINVLPNNNYIFSWGKNVLGTDNNMPYIRVAQYDSNGNFLSRLLLETVGWPNNRALVTAENAASLWDIRIDDASSTRGQHLEEIMLHSGSTPLPYEPYGYKVPVTVSNGTDTLTTPIYLPEQIKKVGDEAEYIDYGEQKQHRVRVNLSEVNEFSNSITDTLQQLAMWVQQGNNNSFVYPSSSNIFSITEPTAITTYITITNDNDSIKIKHNGHARDIVMDIVRGLSPGVYSVSFNVIGYDPTTVGGIVINNIMVNKGSTALPYEPYIENTDLDVTLPVLPTVAGTNVLSVGTEVQPSDMYIKGNIKGGGAA